jgi:hypothetical protein
VKRFYVFVGRHTPEIWALFFASVTLVLGCYAAWTKQPIWLNRAGAIIVIIGVLLAASRFHEWVRSKVSNFIDQDFDAIAKSAVGAIERETGALSDERRSHIIEEVRAETLAELDQIFEQDKRRIKNLEVALVVLGTFLNGLGDYVIGLLKSYGPQSGKGRLLTGPPHTTQHAGPHRAVHQQGAHDFPQA